MDNKYDVVVIGGGHAGIEAGLAASKMGCRTAIFTMSLDQIANMPCNPSIGGTAKGHLVFEINALGGKMGEAADYCMLQSRILNRGKGPAVHSLRMQVDRTNYHLFMKNTIENAKNLDIIQDEIIDILTDNKKIVGVVGKIWGEIKTKTAIISCGTYLFGKIFIGFREYNSGPDGSLAANGLNESLLKHGIELRRFKTGTPPRINKESINFKNLKEQFGDDKVSFFSKAASESETNKLSCFITYTNENVHKIIRENIDKSPLYRGMIEGTGPRYCPSIEDKIMRFKDKERHQIFIEPLGLNTNEIYLQGLSSSLPLEVQYKFIKEIEGLQNAKIMRPAYAIEYDCCDGLSLYKTLEFKKIEGLFGAGQFNGTSGYEEAAAQGIVAGINAALKVKNKDPFILDRQSSYIGTMIDDIVTKGSPEPYRVMTARSENRLELRQDNANERLMDIGFKLGTVSKEKYERYLEEKDKIEAELKRMKKVFIKPTKEVNDKFVSHETTPLKSSQSLYNILKRPELSYGDLRNYDVDCNNDDSVMEKVEIRIKYEGYINKQKKRLGNSEKLKRYKLDSKIDYKEIKGLRLEAIEKLNIVKPTDLYQASRVAGVNPADITVLEMYFKKRGS